MEINSLQDKFNNIVNEYEKIKEYIKNNGLTYV